LPARGPQLNLQGVEKEDITRGDVVTIQGFILPSSLIDIKVEILKDSQPLRNRERIRFHTGTTEVIGRAIIIQNKEIGPGEEGYARIRLESPLVSMSGDRFIIRRFSPIETMGGGVILNMGSERWRSRLKKQISDLINELEVFEKGSLVDKLSRKILSKGFYGIDKESLSGWINYDLKEIGLALEGLKRMVR